MRISMESLRRANLMYRMLNSSFPDAFSSVGSFTVSVFRNVVKLSSNDMRNVAELFKMIGTAIDCAPVLGRFKVTEAVRGSVMDTQVTLVF